MHTLNIYLKLYSWSSTGTSPDRPIQFPCLQMETGLSKWPIYRPFWSPERLCTYKSLDVYIIMYFAMKGIIPLGILNILLHYSLSYHSLHCGCFGPPVCAHNSKMASLGSPSGKPLSADDELIWNFAVLWTRERRSATFRESQNHKLQLGFFPLPSPSRAKFQQQWLHNLFDVTFCELLTIIFLSGAARLHSFKVLPEYNRMCWIPTPTVLETKTHLVYTYTYKNAHIFSYSPLFLHFQYHF